MRKLLVGLVMAVLFSLGALAGTTVFDQITLTTLTDGTLTITGGAITGISGLSFTGDLDITGDTTQTGSLTLVGNLSVDATTASIDGSTSVDLISAGHIDAESADIRLGLNATEYMKLATTVTSGNLAITHPGKTPAVTWTAASFDFTGTMALDATTLSDSLTFSDDATIDNSDANTLTLTETTVAIAGIASITGNLAQDGTTSSIDGSTSVDLLSAGHVDIESADIRIGLDADDYMKLVTTADSANLAITHPGNTPAVTWTATSFDFAGTMALDATALSDALTFSDGATIDNSDATTLTLTEDNINLVGACAADALTLSDVLTFSDDATIDNSNGTTLALTETTIDLVGATLADTLTLSDVLTFSDDATIDNTDANTLTLAETTIQLTGIASITGNLAQDGTTSSIDGSTSVKLLSAALVDVECADIRLGLNATEYMKLATTVTSGNLAITHPGKTPAVTWAAASFAFTGTFEVVGASTLDALTISDVLTFSDDATIDNSDANTLQLTETTIDLVGATLADALTLSDVLTFSDDATIDNSNATTLTLTETTIDLVGATAADALTLSDVLTFSDGGTIDNTDATTLTLTEDNIVFTGNTSVTSTNTATIGGNPIVLNYRERVVVADLNTGEDLLPAIAGRTYRIIDVVVIAYGGAVETTTTVDILGTQSAGGVKLFTFAQADLTQSAVLTLADATVQADGASFTACDAATAITVGVTGAGAATATGVDFILTYVIE